MARAERALATESEPRLAIGGGVAANRLLRERALALGVPVHVPPPELCTDNAAMIASAARYITPVPYPDYLALDAYATRRAA
jgi:N6-L-threonylcarbamoyladenine synthase